MLVLFMKIDNYEIIKKDFLILNSLNYYIDKNTSAFVYHIPIDNCSEDQADIVKYIYKQYAKGMYVRHIIENLSS